MTQTTFPAQSPVSTIKRSGDDYQPLVRSMKAAFPHDPAWSGSGLFLVLNVVPLLCCSASAFIVTKSLRPDRQNFTDIWKSEVWGLLSRTLSFMVLTVGGANPRNVS